MRGKAKPLKGTNPSTLRYLSQCYILFLYWILLLKRNRKQSYLNVSVIFLISLNTSSPWDLTCCCFKISKPSYISRRKLFLMNRDCKLKIHISKNQIIKQAKRSWDLQIDNWREESSPCSPGANKARAEQTQALTRCCNIGPRSPCFQLSWMLSLSSRGLLLFLLVSSPSGHICCPVSSSG